MTDYDEDTTDVVKSHKWAIFVRLSILLSLLSLLFLLRSLHLTVWVESNIIEQSVVDERAENITLGNPFYEFGNVRGARFGVFDFCFNYAVEEWGNDPIPICWRYTQDLTLNGETDKACNHINMESDNLCNISSTTLGAILVALFLLAIADIFSEKVLIVIPCVFLSSIPVAFVIVGTWVGFLFHLRQEEDWMVFNWGSGLYWFLYSLISGIVCTFMITIAFCCYTFDKDEMAEGEYADKWYACIMPFNPWAHSDSLPYNEMVNKEKIVKEKVKHEQLSGRQHFFRDNVGYAGRVGALFGLLAWALLISASHVPDWIVLNDDPNTTITEFRPFRGGHFGFQEYCLKREVRSLGQFNSLQSVCFPYDHEGTITVKNVDGSSQEIIFENIDDMFDNYNINFERRTLISFALFVAVVLAVVGDCYSEWTLFNGVLLFLTSILTIVALVWSGGIIESINDESDNLVTAGTSRTLMLVALFCAILGCICNCGDSFVHGKLRILRLKTKCKCCAYEEDNQENYFNQQSSEDSNKESSI